MSGRQWSVSIRPDVGNRSEGVSGRQWSVSIRHDVGNRSERGERSPSCQWSPLCRYSPVSCPPDDVAPDDDAHTYRSEPVGNSLCVLFLSPLSPVFLWGVGIITRKRLKHTGARERACEPVAPLCPVLPMMSPPMMMHTHTGASLSVIACVCYSCRPCRLCTFGVGKLLPERD